MHKIKEDKLQFCRKYGKFIDFSTNWKAFWYIYTIIVAILLAAQTVYAFRSEDIKTFTEVCITYTYTCELMGKIVVSYVNRDAMLKLIATIDEQFWDVSVIDDRKQRDAINKHFVFIVRISKAYLCLVGVTTFNAVCYPLGVFQDDTKQLPMVLYLPFDSNASPFYEMIYFFLGVHCLMAVFTIFSFNYIVIYCAQHLFVQFQLVQYLLAHLTYKLNENEVGFQREYRNRIAVCVKHHNLITEFGKALMDFASISSGLQLLFAITSGVMCIMILGDVINSFRAITIFLVAFVCFKAMENKEYIRSAKMVAVLALSYFQLIIYAKIGSDLEEYSSNVSEALWQSNWYLAGIGNKHTMVLIQMNTQSLQMKGFYLYPVNNPAIINVAKTIFTIGTLLQAMDS